MKILFDNGTPKPIARSLADAITLCAEDWLA